MRSWTTASRPSGTKTRKALLTHRLPGHAPWSAPCGLIGKDFRSLEDKPRRDGELVVVGVKLGGGNLHACTESDTEAAFLVAGMQLDFAEDNARSQEVLFFAVVFSAKKVG